MMGRCRFGFDLVILSSILSSRHRDILPFCHPVIISIIITIHGEMQDMQSDISIEDDVIDLNNKVRGIIFVILVIQVILPKVGVIQISNVLLEFICRQTYALVNFKLSVKHGRAVRRMTTKALGLAQDGGDKSHTMVVTLVVVTLVSVTLVVVTLV